MLKNLNENNLTLTIEYGFRPEDPFINQLISIAYEIYESLDAKLEVRRERVGFYNEPYEVVFWSVFGNSCFLRVGIQYTKNLRYAVFDLNFFLVLVNPIAFGYP